MQRVLRYLSADYARSRIENVTIALLPACLAVACFARWVEVAA